MSNPNIKMSVTLEDKATSGLKGLEKQIQSIEKTFGGLIKQVGLFSELMSGKGADTSGATTQINKLVEVLNKLKKEFNGDQLKGVGVSISGIGSSASASKIKVDELITSLKQLKEQSKMGTIKVDARSSSSSTSSNEPKPVSLVKPLSSNRGSYDPSGALTPEGKTISIQRLGMLQTAAQLEDERLLLKKQADAKKLQEEQEKAKKAEEKRIQQEADAAKKLAAAHYQAIEEDKKRERKLEAEKLKAQKQQEAEIKSQADAARKLSIAHYQAIEEDKKRAKQEEIQKALLKRQQDYALKTEQERLRKLTIAHINAIEEDKKRDKRIQQEAARQLKLEQEAKKAADAETRKLGLMQLAAKKEDELRKINEDKHNRQIARLQTEAQAEDRRREQLSKMNSVGNAAFKASTSRELDLLERSARHLQVELDRAARAAARAAQETNNMSRAMVGAVQMWGANKIGQAFKATGKIGIEEEYQQLRINAAGINEETKAAINKKAEDMSKRSDVSMSVKDLIPVLTDLAVESRGNMQLFDKNSIRVVEHMQALETLYRSRGMNLTEQMRTQEIRSLDKLGAFDSEQRFKDVSDARIKRVAYYGPDSQSVDRFSQEVDQFKSLRATLNNEGLLQFGAVLDMARASGKDARSLAMFGNELFGNSVTIKEAQYRKDMGLFQNPDKVIINKDKNVDLQRSDLTMIGSKDYQNNPFKWVEEVYMKKLQQKGVDTNNADEVRKEVSGLTINSNQQDILVMIITRMKQLKEEWAALKKAADANEVNKQASETSGFGVDQAKSSVIDFAGTVAKQLTPVIKEVSGIIKDFFDSLNSFAKDNSIATQIAVIATAYTGLALVIGGLVTWMGGLAGALTIVTTGFSLLLSPIRLVWGILAGLGTIVTTVTGGLGAIAFALGGIWARIVNAASVAWAALRAGAAALIPGMIGAMVAGVALLVAIFLFPEAFRNFQIFGSSLTTWAERIVAKIKNLFWELGAKIAEFVVTAGNKLGILSDKAAQAKNDQIQRNLEARKDVNNQRVVVSETKDRAAAAAEAASKIATDKSLGGKVDPDSWNDPAKMKAERARRKAEYEAANPPPKPEAPKTTTTNLPKQSYSGGGTGGGVGDGYKGIREDQKESQFMAAELKELQALYQQGKMNLEEYFSKRVEITNDGINKEIAALQKQLSTAKNAKQAQQIQNKIDVLEKQRTANLADIQADKEKELINIESKRLTIKEKLAQLTGKTQEVELIKIEKEMADLRKSMGGNLTEQDDAMIKQIESIMKAKAAYNDLMQTVKKYEGEADLAHKKASSAAKLGEITATEAARRSEEAYRAEGEAIQALIPKLEELAQKTANPDMIKQIEELKIKSHELANQVGEDAKKMKSDVSGAFEGLFNDLSSGKGIKAALNNFAKNIVDTINKTLSKQMSETITNMLFGQEKNGSFTGGMGNFLQGIISPKGFNGGGSGGLGGLFGNMFGGSSGDGEQGGTAGSFAELGKAASMAMNGLTNMTTNGVTGATTALGENIAKTMMGTSVEMTATAALQQLAAAASSAAAALSSIGGGSGGGGGLLGNLFSGGSPASSSGGGFFESIGSAVGGIFGGFPSYDVGTDFVPKDMYALIHQGEAILPATAAEKFRQFVDGGGMNSQSAGPTIVNNNFTVNGSTTLQSQQQIAKLAADSLNRAARRNG